LAALRVKRWRVNVAAGARDRRRGDSQPLHRVTVSNASPEEERAEPALTATRRACAALRWPTFVRGRPSLANARAAYLRLPAAVGWAGDMTSPRETSLLVSLSHAVAIACHDPHAPGAPTDARSRIIVSDGLRSGQRDPTNKFTVDGGSTYESAHVLPRHEFYGSIPGARWIGRSADGSGTVCLNGMKIGEQPSPSPPTARTFNRLRRSRYRTRRSFGRERTRSSSRSTITTDGVHLYRGHSVLTESGSRRGSPIARLASRHSRGQTKKPRPRRPSRAGRALPNHGPARS